MSYLSRIWLIQNFIGKSGFIFILKHTYFFSKRQEKRIQDSMANTGLEVTTLFNSAVQSYSGQFSLLRVIPKKVSVRLKPNSFRRYFKMLSYQ